MRVSLRWLAEYVDLPTDDPAELAHTLAMIGHDVEATEVLEPQWSGVVVARVDEVWPHPNADKVRLCRVSTGQDSWEVVCGAWNFEAGAEVALAPPGAVLAGGLRIEHRTIRGAESEGMICSEAELGLGDDHSGILVLDGGAILGSPVESVLELPDVVFDLAITSNRPDAMSMVGIARDLAARYDLELSIPSPDPAAVPGTVGTKITVEDAEGCWRFTAREVTGVVVAPSPVWMRSRLRKAGVRPVSNLVDVTNYVMLELGQPLHVFDADRVAGDNLVVRRATEDESIVTLDGSEHRLDPQDLIIADADGPTSLAGTMGGERSEVVPGTTRALVEAAAWDPPTIMYMSKRHGLRSESSARFERGVDPNLPPLASARAAELILATAGGRLLAGWIDDVLRSVRPVTVLLAGNDLSRLLGDEVDIATAGALLSRLGLIVEGANPLQVTVPTYRPDLTRPADLVEEVARLHGYDRFEGRLRVGSTGGLDPEQRRLRLLRQLLVDSGLHQAVSLPFVTGDELEAFRPGPDHEYRSLVDVANPLSQEEAHLRPGLLPGLLRAARRNRNHGASDVALFETGRVFHHSGWSADPRIPSQPERLGFVVAGGFGPIGLDGTARPADVYTATALVRALAERLGVGISLRQGEAAGFHPGRTSQVLVGGARAGHVGELHPRTVAAFDLAGRVAAGELDLVTLISPGAAVPYRPVSAFPPVDFDLSFELDVSVPAASLVGRTQAAGSSLVEAARLFDEFTGSSLGAGRKALAIRYRLRAQDRTLVAEEVGEVRRAMIEAAAELGAVLRGAS